MSYALGVDSFAVRLLAIAWVVIATGCPSRSGTTKEPGSATKPPPPPPGSRFVCERAPLDPRMTWRDCRLTDQPIVPRAFCFTARAASGTGQLHSLCAPTESDCRLWHDARRTERQDVVDPCVPLRASQTGSLDGKPPPRDARFACEKRPDPRRMIRWRDCKVVDVDELPAAHCFVARWRAGRHSVCAPTEQECRDWSTRRTQERNDVLAPCQLARPADVWPLPPP